jgi:hypothetical protein
MDIFQKKTIGLLFLVFLIGFIIIFFMKWIGIPLNIRFILLPIIILILSTIYVFLITPEKPIKFTLTLGIFLVVLTLILSIITHTFIWKDIGSKDFPERLGFLLSLVFLIPLFSGIFYKIILKFKK